MIYQDLLRSANGDAAEAHGNARTALLPYISDGRNAALTRANLRAIQDFPAWLLSVPRRVLKRWATRAVKAGVPRAKRLMGPALAIHRRGTMHPSLRAFMP